MNESKAGETVRAYVNAWNEPDSDKRMALLEIAWSETGMYVDPTVELSGREALSDHIAAMQAKRPGARIVLTSGTDEHHGQLRFHWRLDLGDGTQGAESVDFGMLDRDGRLSRIVGFFGAPPAVD